jgi:hypothetical protein
MTNTVQTPPRGQITAARALEVAEADAFIAYGDLSSFRVQVRLGPQGWNVDYELNEAGLNGGGPHYVIDRADGRILSKRYEQ